jgi:tetratricopeptide (TPR) repeat protein
MSGTAAKLARAVPLLLVLLVAAAYLSVLQCGFIGFDDNTHVRSNPLVSGGLRWEAMVRAFTESHAALWVPVTWISLMLDVSLFGMNPTAFHAVNVLLHIANTVILFLFLRRMCGQVWPAAIVAAFFGLHPLNVESVAWIAERKNVLCGFFFLLCLYHYQRYVERPGWARLMMSWVAAGLALLAKPMAVTLPFVLLLLDYGPFNRFSSAGWKRVFAEKLPFFALSIGSCVVTFLSAADAANSEFMRGISLGNRIRNGLVSYTDYLTDIFWPSDLAVLYPHPFTVPWTPALASVGILAAITGTAFFLRHRFRYLLCGWLWFLGILVPMIGIVQVGPQARADRFTYLAQIGILIAAVFLASDAAKGGLRRALSFAASVAAAALMLATGNQLSYWTHTAYLFEHAARVTKHNTRALVIAGNARMDLGDFENAAENFKQALELHPELDHLWISLGKAFTKLERNEDAQRSFQRALTLTPDSYEANLLVASSLQESGHEKAAISQLETLAAFHPELSDVHRLLGELLLKTGNDERAQIHLAEARRLGDTRPVASRDKQTRTSPEEVTTF